MKRLTVVSLGAVVLGLLASTASAQNYCWTAPQSPGIPTWTAAASDSVHSAHSSAGAYPSFVTHASASPAYAPAVHYTAYAPPVGAGGAAYSAAPQATFVPVAYVQANQAPAARVPVTYVQASYAPVTYAHASYAPVTYSQAAFAPVACAAQAPPTFGAAPMAFAVPAPVTYEALRAPYGATVDGRSVIVRPKVYVPGQPLRNLIRAITP